MKLAAAEGVGGTAMGRRAKTSGAKIRDDAGAASFSPSGESVCTLQGVEDGVEGCVGGLEQGQAQASGRFPDLGSADGQLRGADQSGRQGSHRAAGPSPRCALGWVYERINNIGLELLADIEGPTTLDTVVTHFATIGKSGIGHFIGKKGHMLRKIERFCGVFLILNDSETEVEILMWGPVRACALAQFVAEAFNLGFYSIVDSLSSLSF